MRDRREGKRERERARERERERERESLRLYFKRKHYPTTWIRARVCKSARPFGKFHVENANRRSQAMRETDRTAERERKREREREGCVRG